MKTDTDYNSSTFRNNASNAKITISYYWVALCTLAAFEIFRVAGSNSEGNCDYLSGEALSSLCYFKMGIAVISFFAFILLIKWQYRAYENLNAAGVTLKHGKVWAITGWLVPLLNLYLPFDILKETWEKTQKQYTDNIQSPKLIVVWWMLWILNIFPITLHYNSLNRYSDLFELVEICLQAAIILLTIVILRKMLVFEENFWNHYQQAQNAGAENEAG